MVLPSMNILDFVPTPIKVLFGLSLFVISGTVIINLMLFAWNFFYVGGINLFNGCGIEPDTCLQIAEGVFLGGVNFADFWTLMAIFFLPPMVLFSVKWYASNLKPAYR